MIKSMHKLTVVSMLFAVLLLAGAGCPNQATKSTDKNLPDGIGADAAKPAATSGVPASKSNSGIIITKAEPKGDKTMLVEFEVTDEAKKDAEGYRLLLSNDAMPEWPTKGSWYELGKGHMTKEWKGLPLGKRNLRVCVVKKDMCEMYSEVMEVEVK